VELLERESHRAAMREYAEDARTGSGRIVLVSGEAGVAKQLCWSRLSVT
jgi:hypothetical protein